MNKNNAKKYLNGLKDFKLKICNGCKEPCFLLYKTEKLSNPKPDLCPFTYSFINYEDIEDINSIKLE